MNDFIDKSFSDLGDYYPGSKRKRKEKVEPKREVEPDLSWDTNSKTVTLPNGNEVEMFTIGALAAALGRPIITVRTWINSGYLPAAPYRLPSKTNVHGKEHLGKRLYSRAMVEKVVSLFNNAGLLYLKRIEWEDNRQLSNEIAEAWSQIRAEETK